MFLDPCSVEIGGYLDISANGALVLDKNAVYLNASRYCLEYIVRARKFSSVWLPYYGCHTLADTLKKLEVVVNFYYLNENLLPIIPNNARHEPVVYINYYGLHTQHCLKVINTFPTVIIDNAQAYHTPPFANCDCIYSPRKFFGLPDGGILFPGSKIEHLHLKKDISYDRIEHLFKRVDCGAESAYQASLMSRHKIASTGMRTMSSITKAMLMQIDIDLSAKVRRENWNFLHQHLKDKNEFSFSLSEGEVPLFYPFLFKKTDLRTYLNNNKIFTPSYWPKVTEQVTASSYEQHWVKYMHPLPIDQRYGLNDMSKILSVLAASGIRF